MHSEQLLEDFLNFYLNSNNNCVVCYINFAFYSIILLYFLVLAPSLLSYKQWL